MLLCEKNLFLYIFKNSWGAIPNYISILDYCREYSISIKDVEYVDDVLGFLREAERHGICSYHISSFLDYK